MIDSVEAAREGPPHLEAGALDRVVEATTVSTGRADAQWHVGSGDAGQDEWVLDRHSRHDARQPPCVRNYSRRGPTTQATGSSSRPRRVRRPFHLGSSVASSIFGKRVHERAERDPALRAAPAPRRGSGGSRCRTRGAAPRRRGSGRRVSASSPQCAGSRLAEPSTTKTNVPAAIVRSSTSTSTVVTRRENCTGGVVAEELVDGGGRDRRIVLPTLELRRGCATTRACRCR